jgi:CubicO group peptidase (beta-lactamase class C family)
MGGVAGHAGLLATAADAARFARVVLNRGTLMAAGAPAETVNLMTTVQSPEGVRARRGLGWDIDSISVAREATCFPGRSLWPQLIHRVCL